MTREHKLAMIVGFALVLVVGVLVSDHLSRARTARMAGASIEDVALRGDDVAFGRRTPEPRAPAVRTPFEVDAGIARGTPPADAIQTAPAGDPLVTDHWSDQVAVESTLAPDNGTIELRPSTLPPVASATDQVYTEPVIKMGEPVVTEPVVEQIQTLINPATTDIAARNARRYTVEEGDTLWSIARSEYGDGRLAEQLAKFNRGRLTSSGQLRAGSTLMLPEKSVLTGEAAPARGTTRPEAAPSTRPAPPRREPAAKSRTYIVRSGDTLGEISKKQLGTSRRWEEILRLNADRIDDENALRVGTVLKMPAA